MDSWRKVWRSGLAPLLSVRALEALQQALASDDVHLIQGDTVVPPPSSHWMNYPVEAACAVGFCGWQGEGLETVAEVNEYFGLMCFEIDQRMSEPTACLQFLKWVDETPREEMRRELLAEVELALAGMVATNG